MKFPKIRKHYEKTTRLQFATTGPSMTHQSMKAECDINGIMAKWQKTGVIEHRTQFEGQYADFTNTPGDFQEAQNQVLAAEEMFLTLPSKIRTRFHNDPGAFLDFTSNPDNADEMVKLGLATRRELDVIEDAPKPKKTQPEVENPE